MPRSRTPVKQRELDDLHRVLRVIMGHADEILAATSDLRLLPALDGAYAEGDLTGLRLLRTDMLEMLLSYTPAQRRELDGRLRAEAATTLDAVHARQLKRLDTIYARGRITTEEQVYLVRGRMEEIWDDPERVDEFHKLQALYVDYGERAARRAKRRRSPPADAP